MTVLFTQASSKASIALLLGLSLGAGLAGCSSDNKPASTAMPAAVQHRETSDDQVSAADSAADEFQVVADRFADIRVLRYQTPGFESLSLQQKTLLHYLAQAGMAGRDIIWHQNYRHNLRIRHTLESVVKHYPGDRDSSDFEQFMQYTKQVWFANGIHHHYSNDKFTPEFSAEYFSQLVTASAAKGQLPRHKGESVVQLIAQLTPILFDPNIDAKKVNLAADVDKVASSAVNFYQQVTEAEVVDFYSKKTNVDDSRPVSHGLNSTLVKEDGQLVEKVWKVGGVYGPALEQVVFWLEKAVTVAENEQQKDALTKLAKYFVSGDLKDFDDYNIAWVQDTKSRIDVTNGFIEVYSDPLGYRGAFESVVSFRDEVASKRIATIADNAQWFEDNSPLQKEHKKSEVKGITGKAIIVVSETGDSSPSTPVGINLPNSAWIRAEHGSKSVTLSNISAAYSAARGKSLEEFAFSEQEISRAKAHAELASFLHVDMHEVIGHASGKLNDGVGTPKETLKQYASTMEEGRADLVALYYAFDPKLVEIGVMPSLETGRAEYDRYLRSGLITQLQRIKPGRQIEEAHMRNRQIIASWVFEQGQAENIVEKKIREGKTYIVINDYAKLRSLFGQLLREFQRIKSEGDFQAAQALVEGYGVKVDAKLHAEVLQRFAALDVAAYSGFINPQLVPVMKDGNIVDIEVQYPDDFSAQMLHYSEQYSLLPAGYLLRP